MLKAKADLLSLDDGTHVISITALGADRRAPFRLFLHRPPPFPSFSCTTVTAILVDMQSGSI